MRFGFAAGCLMSAGTAAACAMSAGTAGAATYLDYTGSVVFGDSLTDTGRTAALVDIVSRIPLIGDLIDPVALGPYVDGRFANGPVWYDRVAADFNAQGKPALNFAFGGAEAEAEQPFEIDLDDIFGTITRFFQAGGVDALDEIDVIPDLDSQVELFDALIPDGALGANPLATIWIGANDFLGDPANPDVTTEATEAATAIGDAVFEIAEEGIDDFAIFSYGDLGMLPAFNLPGRPPELAQNGALYSQAFNAVLAAEIAALRAAGLTVTEVDLGPALELLFDEPGAFGVEIVDLPCLLPAPSGVVACDNPEDYVFWDPVHFTTQIHGEIAALFEDALHPGSEAGPPAIPAPPALPLLAGAIALPLLARLRGRGVGRMRA